MIYKHIEKAKATCQSPEIVDTFFEEFGAFFVPVFKRLDRGDVAWSFRLSSLQRQ